MQYTQRFLIDLFPGKALSSGQSWKAMTAIGSSFSPAIITTSFCLYVLSVVEVSREECAELKGSLSPSENQRATFSKTKDGKSNRSSLLT
jgi:hypothetical protein